MSVMSVVFTQQVEHADLQFTPSVNSRANMFPENSGQTSGCSDWSLTRQKLKNKILKFLELISKTLISNAFLEQSAKLKLQFHLKKEPASANWS